MQLLDIMPGVRNGSLLSKEAKLKIVHEAIAEFNKKIPFVGRILTSIKHFGGLITVLEFKNGNKKNLGKLKFTITDCNFNHKSGDSAKTYQAEVDFDNLEDVQTC